MMRICNMTTQRQHIGSKSNLEMVSLSVLLLIVVASFLAGSLLGEDSTGGMRFDFYTTHWLTIKRFAIMPWRTALANYYNPENPLLYIIASLLPLHGDPKLYHAITFAAGLSFGLFFRRHTIVDIVNSVLIGCGRHLGQARPAFADFPLIDVLGDTYWLPFAFCAITSLLLSRSQDAETERARPISPFTLIALAMVSSCAFYTRQYYAFVPIIAAWIVLTRTRTSPFLVLSVFVIAMTPELYLIYLWKGRSTFSSG